MIPEPEGRERRTTLRPIVPDDLEFLGRLYASTREDIVSLPLSTDDRKELVWMQFRAQDEHYRRVFPSADFNLILEQRRPVGRLYVERNAEEIRLIDIALLPEFRHQGLGREILDDLLAEGFQTNKPVRLRVEPHSRALRLYQRLGFSTVADEKTALHLERPPQSVCRGAGA